MKRAILIAVVLLSTRVFSQTVVGLGYTRYIGFNTNPILAQVIPFNNINPQLASASLMFRSYNYNDNGIRAAYGLQLSNESSFQSMFISVDNDRRRNIGSSNWMYYQGFGVGLKIVTESLNRNSTVPIDDQQSFFLGWHWGVEYQFNDVVSLATEGTFRLGVSLDEGESFLKIDPPFNIVAHFNLSN